MFLFLLIIDYILFAIYQNINPKLTFYAQIFGYLESKPFQIITISFILPILLFLIADVFKIKEKLIDEKKERQIGSINQTQELWNDISCLTTEFIYTEKFDELKLAKLHSKIDEFIIKAENIANIWYFEFSDLKKILSDDVDFTDVYLLPFNVILSCISSTIDFRNLNEFNDKDCTQILLKQEYIRLIYEGVKGAAHHNTMRMLRNSKLFIENPSDDIEKQLKEDFRYLKGFSFKLIKEIYKYYPYESSDNDFKEFNEYIEEIKYAGNYNYENFKDKIEIIYKKLPENKKLILMDPYYFSTSLIKDLAYIMKIQEVSADYNHVRKQYKDLNNATLDELFSQISKLYKH